MPEEYAKLADDLEQLAAWARESRRMFGGSNVIDIGDVDLELLDRAAEAVGRLADLMH